MIRTVAALSLAIALAACATHQPQYSLEGSGVRMAKADAERAHAGAHPTSLAGGDVDTPAQLIRSVFPSYPRELIDANTVGSVTVRFDVDSDGTVGNATVVGSPPAQLGAITLRAIKQWQFAPALRAGVPVRTRVAQTFRFQTE